MPIIAAVDQSKRSESVIEQARELADVYGVELHVVHVGSFVVANVPDESLQDSTSDINQAQEEARKIAAEAADNIEGHGEFKAVGLIGDPAEELINYSAKHNAEYIVVSGRKQSPLGRVMSGSVTQSLLLSADRPIVANPHDVE